LRTKNDTVSKIFLIGILAIYLFISPYALSASYGTSSAGVISARAGHKVHHRALTRLDPQTQSSQNTSLTGLFLNALVFGGIFAAIVLVLWFRRSTSPSRNSNKVVSKSEFREIDHEEEKYERVENGRTISAEPVRVQGLAPSKKQQTLIKEENTQNGAPYVCNENTNAPELESVSRKDEGESLNAKKVEKPQHSNLTNREFILFEEDWEDSEF
jgi:hypothetical protein